MLSFSSFVWHDTVLQVRQFAEFKDWRCVNLKLIIKKLTLPQFEFQKYLVILFWTFVMWFSFSAFFKFWNPFYEMATIIENSVGSSIDFPSIERVRAPTSEHFRARASPSIRYSSIEHTEHSKPSIERASSITLLR